MSRCCIDRCAVEVVHYSRMSALSVKGVAVRAQAMQIARNATTNEMANWTRYKYLHGPDGGFRNPFDRGWRANCAEALCAQQPPPLQLLPAAIESTSLLPGRMEEGGMVASDKRED